VRIAIIDPVTPKPYSGATLRDQPLGGTEATVIRIAEALDAIVLQHNRGDDEGRYRVASSTIDPTHVVVLREPAAALDAARRYPDSKILLWLHDLCGPGTARGKKMLDHAVALAEHRVTLVCVSDFHANDVRRNFLALSEGRHPAVVRVYNPVDVTDAPDGARPTDPNKLVFFSSPHKGLDYTLTIFKQLRARNKHLRLFIANPGYLPSTSNNSPGIVNLGAVPHSVIMEHVSTALCTFYPNYVYPETFGLALGESNALGTPVLTHNIGAAEEVLNGPDQFIRVPAVRNLADSVFWRMPSLRAGGEASLGLLGFSKGYRERIERWQEDGRPAVAGRPEFSTENVVQAWRAVLSATDVALATA
jgi:glycosyltransferase involved in cell wall biosynthesis